MLPLNVDSEAFGQSFNFSNFPNLREVEFVVRSVGGGLAWIPTAFTTLGPATSPHLSAIRLQLSCTLSAKTLIRHSGDDLQKVADEVVRIEREFGEAVNFVLHRDLAFKGVLDTLDVRFCCCGLHPVGSSVLPHRSFRVIDIVERSK